MPTNAPALRTRAAGECVLEPGNTYAVDEFVNAGSMAFVD